MNLLIPQASSSVTHWQADIKAFAKMEKTNLKKVLLLNCSFQAKISLLKGLKQILKTKLNQVNDQKQKLQQLTPKPGDMYQDEFKLVSEKNYLILSGRCLNQIEKHQFDSLKKLQTLISLKETSKSKKKSQLKSQYIKKSNPHLIQGFYVPEAKMTSSVIICSQLNTQINKSTIMEAQKNKYTTMDKSLQLRSKIQISQLYQTHMCSILEPISQQARLIFRKNKFLINMLKQGHKKQVQINLWLKQVKLAPLQMQLTKKVDEVKKNDQQAVVGPTSTQKNQSDTTGSPDEKQMNVSDIKICLSCSDSKKFQCQPRKNLLQEEKAFSIKVQNEDGLIKQKKNGNDQNSKEELSPKQGRKKSQIVNRPSGYSKNICCQMNEQEQIDQLSKLSYYADNKIGIAFDFKAELEPSKMQIEEKIQMMSRMMLNKNVKLSNLGSEKGSEGCEAEPGSSLKVYYKAKSKQISGSSYNSKNRSIISNVKNIIQEEDQYNHQRSSVKSSQSEDQIFYQHIDKKSHNNLNNQAQQNQSIAAFKHSAQQITFDSNLNQNNYMKNQDQRLSISTKTIQNQANLFKRPQIKKEPNIFKNQPTIAPKNSHIFLNAQDKQNNSLSLNTNSSLTFKQNSSQKPFSEKPFEPSNAQQSSSSPFDNIHSLSQNPKNPFDIAPNSKKSNHNLMGLNSHNIFRIQQNANCTKKNNFNVFYKDDNHQSNSFIPKKENNVFNRPQNNSINPFTVSKQINIFESNKKSEIQSLYQRNSTQEGLMKNSPNVFGPNKGKNFLIEPGLNIFGNPIGLKKQSEYSDESPPKIDEGMRMKKMDSQEKFFFY